MRNKLKLIAAAVALSLGLAGAAAVPTYAQGAAGGAKSAVCEGITAGGGACSDNGQGLTKVISTVISILSVIVGLAAVIMIIVGGLKYVTSGGDSSSIASAKSTIIYALVGLIIAALAQFIVKFVFDKATS